MTMAAFERKRSSIFEMERPSSSAGRRGPRRSVAGYEHIEQTQQLMTSIIHELVHAGDIAALKEELQRDKSLIECLNSEGMTPLFVAVSMGNLELVQFLATSGAELDSKDNLGRTPVALASYQGWNDGVYYLLALGANQTIVDNCGRLPIHAATYYSNQRTVQIILKQLPQEFVNTQDCEGMTAFHWTAFHGRADLVRLLVEHGAELITRDNEGKTALHWAAQNGGVDCCRAILNTVAGQHLLNGKDFSGKTPIHFAAAAGHADALQELITEKFANIDLGDAEDRTPLHWAAATGHALCAIALLRAGADKDCVDKDGASPLMYAQQRGHKLCSELIFNHDPDNPLNTRLPDNIVERSKTNTPPEIHIDTSPSGFGMNVSVSRCSSAKINDTKDVDKPTADDDDHEVQEIFCQNVEEVLVDVNPNNGKKDNKSSVVKGEGRISSLLHDLRKPSPSGSISTSPWLLFSTTMNGHDGDSSGFSSDDEHRYPPQMVLTPIPGSSPIPTEDNNNNSFEENRPPPPFSRFSFEENVHAPFLKPPSTAAVLAPLRPKKVPEHLRLDTGYNSSAARIFEFKPVTTPLAEPTLAPLKITKVKQLSPPIKHQGLPLMQQPTPNRQLVTSPTRTLRSISGGQGSANVREGSSDSGDFSRFWARRKKPEPAKPSSSSSSRCKQMNRSLSIPEARSGSKGASGFTFGGTDLRQLDSDSEFSRKLKDKQSSPGGQILPAISNDKPNKVSQVHGSSFKDQIARFRRSVKKKQKNKSGITTSFDDRYEENSKPSKVKEKKKIRKVMSWNT